MDKEYLKKHAERVYSVADTPVGRRVLGGLIAGLLGVGTGAALTINDPAPRTQDNPILQVAPRPAHAAEQPHHKGKIVLAAAQPVDAKPAQSTPSPEALPSYITIPWLGDTARPWAQIVSESCRAENIDPEFGILMLQWESTGSPTIVSSVGAVGLLQIMPATAEAVARELDMTSHDLRNPADNIRIGCHILAQLNKKYGDGAVPLSPETRRRIIIAYNAGGGKLNQVLAGTASTVSETNIFVDFLERMWNQRHDPQSEAFDKWKSFPKVAQTLEETRAELRGMGLLEAA